MADKHLAGQILKDYYEDLVWKVDICIPDDMSAIDSFKFCTSKFPPDPWHVWDLEKSKLCHVHKKHLHLTFRQRSVTRPVS